MNTLPRSKPAVKPSRLLTYHPELGILILTVTTGRKVEKFGYFVDAIPSDFGRAFRLIKTPVAGVPSVTYHVNIGGDGHGPSCECKGFLRWGSCKHTESLATLVAAGRI